MPSEIEFLTSVGRGGDGIYGARRVGWEFGTSVLVVGRPLALVDLLDMIRSAFHARFENTLEVALL